MDIDLGDSYRPDLGPDGESGLICAFMERFERQDTELAKLRDELVRLRDNQQDVADVLDAMGSMCQALALACSRIDV